MDEMWTPFLDVCKCAEKPVLMQQQRCAFWCICLCRLQEGEPIFYGEWQKSINQAYHPTITAIYSVRSTRSPAPATKQKLSPCLCSEETYAPAVTQVIQDIFQLICSHLGLASQKPGVHITFFIGWKHCHKPPCYRRTALPVHFQLASFSLFLPPEIRNLQGEKRKFLVMSRRSFPFW